MSGLIRTFAASISAAIYAVSGTGTLNTPAIAPEPAYFALFLAGLLVIGASKNLVRQRL